MSNDNKLALDRIIFFSDAVFAIAITLLALELRVPDMPTSQVAAEMPQRLAGMMPKFVSFILSFVIIGSYWHAHHRDFLIHPTLGHALDLDQLDVSQRGGLLAVLVGKHTPRVLPPGS